MFDFSGAPHLRQTIRPAGTPLADGTFEEVNGRLYRTYRWSLLNDAQASGGQYLQDGITGAAHVWFPFTGDSV
ncbi:MAG: hypothetical protein KDE45_16515, partial [Caldilineaceae bacterium]|nr:hypothetical protein [Caldilineaceae bacterium]